ncbi:cell division site-positioning protein MapZ family protein [Vagococcus jeotgali]|uniref:cell division site-positioning protein MapZ family protein n=1 Tax=Vagococcus jeotgali TaxID=3109030 RepID=UPI002DDAD557|nr:cell division site-positioning protein MapZ family protein [Vagococcus sp. B2T-5]
MKNEEKKCPSCGHVFKDGQTYCPNCDLFVPVEDQEKITETTTTSTNTNIDEFSETTETQDEANTIPTFKHRNMKASESDLTHDDSTYSREVEDSKEIVVDQEVVETKETMIETPEKNEETPPVEEVVIETVIPTPDVATQNESQENTQQVSPASNGNNPTRKDKKNNNKTVNILIAIIAILVIFGGGYIFYSHNQQTKLEERITLTNEADKAIQDLYLANSGDIFLKAGITSEDFKSVETKVNDLKGTEQYASLNEKLMHAQSLFNKEQAINDSFKTPVMVGDQLNKEAYVVNDSKLTLDKIDPEENGFDKLYNQAINEANSQKKALKDFDDTLEKLYRDDKVVKEPSQRIYDKAVEQLKAIKDPEVRKEFEPILNKVKKEIDEQNKEQELAREREEELQRQRDEEAYQKQLAREEAEKEQQKAKPTTPKKEANTSNQRMGNREDSNIDLSNDAWAWAPGVEQEFISEVISRGYVVEGGYTLVPKYVENGEGFYDLYATTNSKIFPKSKPEEFPLYVVTVNAKTGWFKGNGPN